MGKKDEEIERLTNELSVANSEKFVLQNKANEGLEMIGELEAKNKGLTEQNQRLGDKMDKDREAYVERSKQLEMESKEILVKMREEFEHLDNMKTPLDLEVDVKGVQDIPKCLDDAVALMESRFEALGLGGKYNIIAHPQTMKLSLLV